MSSEDIPKWPISLTVSYPYLNSTVEESAPKTFDEQITEEDVEILGKMGIIYQKPHEIQEDIT